MADPRLRAEAEAESASESEPSLAPERPIFYFDFASPECWLAAERVNQVLPIVPVWTPIAAMGRETRGPPAEPALEDLERRAIAQGLPAPRLPDPWPEDLDVAVRAATFAAASGRVVAFSLAALRQAFAGGRDLSQIDNVLIAAAACELHPRAVLKGIASRSVESRMQAASANAREGGLREVPAVAAEARLFQGADAIERAAMATGSG